MDDFLIVFAQYINTATVRSNPFPVSVIYLDGRYYRIVEKIIRDSFFID